MNVHFYQNECIIKGHSFFLCVALLVPLRFFTCERQLCVTELFLYPIKRIRSRTFLLLYEKIKELHFAIAREHDVNFNWVFMNSPSSFDPIKMSFLKFETFYVTWSVNYFFEYTLLQTSEPFYLFSAQIYKTKSTRLQSKYINDKWLSLVMILNSLRVRFLWLCKVTFEWNTSLISCDKSLKCRHINFK